MVIIWPISDSSILSVAKLDKSAIFQQQLSSGGLDIVVLKRTVFGLMHAVSSIERKVTYAFFSVFFGNKTA